jgi:hypothetical protein
LNWWDATLNWLTKTIPWQVMFGLFVTTGVLLFLSRRLGIYEWAHPYRGIEIAVFTFCGAVLLANIGSGVAKWATKGIQDWTVRRRGEKYLHHLNPEEKAFCRHFIETSGNPLPHNPAKGAISSLLANGILWQPEQGWGKENRGRDWLFEFNIQPWALEYLKKHRELLS